MEDLVVRQGRKSTARPGKIKSRFRTPFGEFVKRNISPRMGDSRDASNQNRQSQLFRDLERRLGHLFGFLEGGGFQKWQVTQFGIDA